MTITPRNSSILPFPNPLHKAGHLDGFLALVLGHGGRGMAWGGGVAGVCVKWRRECGEVEDGRRDCNLT